MTSISAQMLATQMLHSNFQCANAAGELRVTRLSMPVLFPLVIIVKFFPCRGLLELAPFAELGNKPRGLGPCGASKTDVVVHTRTEIRPLLLLLMFGLFILSPRL